MKKALIISCEWLSSPQIIALYGIALVILTTSLAFLGTFEDLDTYLSTLPYIHEE